MLFDQVFKAQHLHNGDSTIGVAGFGLLLLFLLCRILLPLPLSTPHTLSCKALISKGCPRSEVLAAFAPLDFKPCLGDNPDIDITHGAETLILSWYYSIGVVTTCSSASSSTFRLDTPLRLLVLVCRRARARLATHNTASHPLR